MNSKFYVYAILKILQPKWVHEGNSDNDPYDLIHASPGLITKLYDGKVDQIPLSFKAIYDVNDRWMFIYQYSEKFIGDNGPDQDKLRNFLKENMVTVYENFSVKKNKWKKFTVDSFIKQFKTGEPGKTSRDFQQKYVPESSWSHLTEPPTNYMKGVWYITFLNIGQHLFLIMTTILIFMILTALSLFIIVIPIFIFVCSIILAYFMRIKYRYYGPTSLILVVMNRIMR